ncbi:hypothetical protein BEN49_22315, partial [Hymenobacter coccineus]
MPGREGTSRGRGRDNHRFVEAVRWLARNGARWRALPPERGNRHTAYPRFQRWAASGAWQRVFEAVQDEAAWPRLLTDSTTGRVHHSPAGRAKKTARQPWAVAAAGDQQAAP